MTQQPPDRPLPVELRLIGDPADVDAALAALATAGAVVAPGRRKPTRDRRGRVIQYGSFAPTTTPGKVPCP